jgi:hypothetical protein
MTYTDTEISDGVIRIFDQTIDPIELKWHRDDEDRMIVPLEPTDWKIQLEDRLPQDFTSEVFISRGEWHRVIKGTGSLKVKIVKNYEFDK